MVDKKGILFLLMLLCSSIVNLAQDTTKMLILPDTSYTVTDPDFELILSASEGDTTMIEALLKYGANVNAKTIDGVTPLMYAAQSGHLKTVELLLHNGASVNSKPYNRIDALLGAVIAGHVFIADTLIQNGAYINSTDLNHHTPLMYAVAYHDTIMTDMLLFYGANVFMKDKQGNTALHIAAFYGSFESVVLLLEHNSDINYPDNHGFTPLMIAAQNGFPHIVSLLIDYGAEINKKNDYGMSALSLAIINGNYETVRILLENGADPNEQTGKNKNPLFFATKYRNKQIKELLIANGATPNARPVFDIVKPGIAMDFNNKDFLGGFSIGVFESKYWVNLETGFLNRPWVRTVLKDVNNEKYQMWEKRSYIYLGLSKYFLLFKIKYNNYGGLTAGGNLLYTYGSFRGSSLKPKARLKFAPKAGIFWRMDRAEVKLNYQYLDFINDNISPHRITFTLSYMIGANKYKEKLKSPPKL
jgi:ankyrin repeat protein